MRPSIKLSAVALAAVMSLGSITVIQVAHAANDTNMRSDQPVTDSWITTKVKSELATAKGVRSRDISVKTVDGTVMLIGVLPSHTEVKKAIAVAEAVKGVKNVDSTGLKTR